MLHLARPIAAVGAAAALLLAPACGDHEVDGYDDAVAARFLTRCEAQPDASAELCECIYERYVEEIPFERFVEIDEAVSNDPESLPDDAVRLAIACAAETAGDGSAETSR